MCQKEEDMSSYKEGQVHQLMERLEAEGFTPEDITKLGQYKDLGKIRQVVRGYAKIVPVANIVDCDAMPEILSDWQKEEHRKSGKVELEHRDGKLYANGQEVARYLSEKQKDGKVVGGHELRQELADKPVLNACVLDYLLKHPELIPEEWKNGVTYFWGTIFRRSGGNLYVAYLFWGGGGWRWRCDWLGYGWRDYEPAACLASS
jgi:hypothetical protein